MRKRWVLVALTLVLLAALVGCSSDEVDMQNPPTGGQPGDVTQSGDAQPGDTPGDTTEPGEPGADAEPAEPQTKEGTILIEGMEEPVTLLKFDAPDDWPLQFSTWYPDSWLAETESTEEGQRVRFVANYGGNRNDDVFFEVFVYPDGTTEEDVLARAADLAEELGINAISERRYGWTMAEYAGVTDAVNVLLVGGYGQNFFHVWEHYPGEFGDGYAPRAQLVMNEWLFDTGDQLNLGK